MDNALKAINAALALLNAAQAAFATASALMAKARAEGRDISDAELDELRAASQSKLDGFRAQVGG